MPKPTPQCARKRADSVLQDTIVSARKHKPTKYLLDGICGLAVLPAYPAPDLASHDDSEASRFLYQYIEDLADVGVYEGIGLVEPVNMLTPSSHRTARQMIRSMVRASEEKRVAQAQVTGATQVAKEKHVELDGEEDTENTESNDERQT